MPYSIKHQACINNVFNLNHNLQDYLERHISPYTQVRAHSSNDIWYSASSTFATQRYNCDQLTTAILMGCVYQDCAFVFALSSYTRINICAHEDCDCDVAQIGVATLVHLQPGNQCKIDALSLRATHTSTYPMLVIPLVPVLLIPQHT